MSVLLLLLFGGFLFLGMFFLAADLLKMPYMKTEKALLDRGRNSKKGSAALDTFLLQSWFTDGWHYSVFVSFSAPNTCYCVSCCHGLL